MYFDGITIGTKVYDRDGGEWEVIGVPSLYFVAALKDGRSFYVKYDGFLFGFESLGQQFFWAPPQQIEIPPRPKRMVKHKEIFLDVEWNDRGYDPLYPSGTNLFGKLRKVTGKKTTMTLEWEEEE